MSTGITIPLWLFLLLFVATLWMALERFLIPGTRWFLRRKIDRVLDEIGSRLDIEIRPFQLTKRQVLIDRLVYDPKVVEAIQTTAQEQDIPRGMVQAEIQAYAREIVPSFNAYLYFRTGYWIAKKVARLLYWVRVGQVDNRELAAIAPDSTVVFVMNHRSNMDYILVAFLAAERTTLSYAVGEWARIWPLQMLIRAMGAYFVRRNSGNSLYRLVLERYVHMATKEGVCQAVFPEGGLTRDGRLRQPKMGIFDYMLRGFDWEADRDLVFIPVGINYERTLEDRSLVRALDPGAEKRSSWFVAKTIGGFIGRNLMQMTRHKWHRFGFACVNFGTPLSVRGYCQTHDLNFAKLDRDARIPLVGDIALNLMEGIEKIVPILPISLVAALLLQARQRWLSEFDIKAGVHRMIETLQARDAPVLAPTRGLEVAIETAFNMLKIRRMVVESNDKFRVHAECIDILSYYANSIAYWYERTDDRSPGEA